MRWINEITADPRQRHTLLLDDGSTVTLTLTYIANQRGWFYDATYTGFIVSGKRVVMSPNMLRAFRDIIPFGFACVVSDGLEPIFQNDFVNQRAKFYLLTNAEEVADVESRVINA